MFICRVWFSARNSSLITCSIGYTPLFLNKTADTINSVKLSMLFNIILNDINLMNPYCSRYYRRVMGSVK